MLPGVAHCVRSPQVQTVHDPPVDRLGVVATGIQDLEVIVAGWDGSDVLGFVGGRRSGNGPAVEKGSGRGAAGTQRRRGAMVLAQR